MARHRSAHPAIQLFPFLAVLVSVMGALIFLLLITSKRIPQVAMARARAAQAQAVPAAIPKVDVKEPVLSIPELESEPLPSTISEPPQPLADMIPAGPTPAELRAQEREATRAAEQASLIDRWRQRIKALQENRDQWEANVQRQTLITTAAERKQLQMLTELQELERKLGTLTGRVSVGSMQTGSADKERLQLEQRMLGLRRQIKAVTDQQRADAGKYSIVPYDGKSGTTRRPILIECTSTGFRFVPEDVFIGAGDIEGFTERQNPLLAGATALTQYWNQFNQQQGTMNADNQPYVLLIVRPSGTLGYYVSVKLLGALKQPHGYELVAEDVDLKWPAVDVGAQAACRAAVEGMLANRGAVAGGTGSGGGSPGGGNVSATGGDDISGNGGGEMWTGRGGGIGGGPAMDGPAMTPGSRASVSTGSPGGATRGGGPAGNGGSTGAQGKSFQLTDLEPRTEEIGNRSWEDTNRFGGQEHRRDKTKTTGSPSGGSSGPTAEPTTNQRTGSPPAKTVSTRKVDDSDEAPPARVVPTPRPTPTRPTNRPRSSSPSENEQRIARAPRHGNGQDIPYEQLQRRRWGQFDEGANIGVEKSVTIRVDAEQMIVANQLIIPIRPGASRNELFDYLLAALDENANSWGPAATGFFWIPSLKFVISPGGNQIYNRIAPLVTRSGLRADAEFTLDKPDTPEQGGQP